MKLERNFKHWYLTPETFEEVAVLSMMWDRNIQQDCMYVINDLDKDLFIEKLNKLNSISEEVI